MIFHRKNKKQLMKYAAQEESIQKLMLDVEKLRMFGGMPVCVALKYLPDDTICNINYKPYRPYRNDYRHIKAKDALAQLSYDERKARVLLVQHDLHYDGSKNPAQPICILEVPPVI